MLADATFLFTCVIFACTFGYRLCSCADRTGEPVSVTQDMTEFLRREWPLAGRPVVPHDAMPASMCACGKHGNGAEQGCANEVYAGSSEQVWADDWDAPDEMRPKVIKISRPPAVPNSSGPPGRFFPVPVQPVFTPQVEVSPYGMLN